MGKYNLDIYYDYIDSVEHLNFLKYLDNAQFDDAINMINNGFDINSKFILNYDTPISRTVFDLVCCREELYDFMIQNGYKVSDKYDNSLFEMAAFAPPKLFFKRLMLLISISNNEAAYLHHYVSCYGAYPKNLDLLAIKGITISKFGGLSLSELIYFDKLKLAIKFIFKGANINYHGYNTVLASSTTPLIISIEKGKLFLALLLILKGADVTISDSYGVRPFDMAVRKGYYKFAAFLNKIEPKEFKLSRKQQKDNFNLPQELIDFLNKEKKDRIIYFSSQSLVKYIEFYSYDDITWFNYKKNLLIDLVSYVDGYSTPMFVLNTKNNKVYGIDFEHNDLSLIADWNKFYKNMEFYVNKYINGE